MLGIFCFVLFCFYLGAGYMGWLTFWKFTLMILYFSAGSHTSKTFFKLLQIVKTIVIPYY